MARKVCVVTGSRSEYGLLFWLLKALKSDPAFKLQIIATAMHLSPEFGLTYKKILEDDFIIDEKVEMLLSSDTSVGITKSMGLGVIGFADAYARLSPDLIVLLGDRFETLAAAQAALIAKIPIAHIHGGELSLGAYDDAIRHSITKMSHLHFVATQEYRRRVIQLGEDPENIHCAGAMVIDSIRELPLLKKEELEQILDIRFNELNFVVTFHPETLGTHSSSEQVNELLQALDRFPSARIIFTKSNADNDGRIINQMIDNYCGKNKNAKAFIELGFKNYLSLLNYVDLVIGNSSSGIIEAPYFKIPTVNIGDRQAGRTRALSVIDCLTQSDAIYSAMTKGLRREFKQEILNMDLPYGNEGVAAKIIATLKNVNLTTLVRKRFYDLKVD